MKTLTGNVEASLGRPLVSLALFVTGAIMVGIFLTWLSEGGDMRQWRKTTKLYQRK